MKHCREQGFEKALHLTSSVSTSNMVLFDPYGNIKTYKSVLDIMRDFAKVRIETYKKRKDHMVKKLKQQEAVLTNKCRFVKMVIAKKLVVRKRKIAIILQDLESNGFEKWSAIKSMVASDERAEDEEAEANEQKKQKKADQDDGNQEEDDDEDDTPGI